MSFPHGAPQETLLTLFKAALSAVEGRLSTSRLLESESISGKFYLISVGKSAASMALGAYDASGDQIISSFVVTKDESFEELLSIDNNVQCFQSAHPIPGERSLKAGEALLRFIANTPEDSSLLFLISGGTSSLVEVLNDGVSLSELVQANEWLLSHGFNIHEINAFRKRISKIKGGGLLNYLGSRKCWVRLISDVPGNVISNIGSGWLFPEADPVELPILPKHLAQLVKPASTKNALTVRVNARIIASNREARQSIAQAAEKMGFEVYSDLANEVSGDVEQVANELADALVSGKPGIYVFGGEATVTLPDNPGRGGRNQQLALLVADRIKGYDNITFLAAGTDGSDGPTQDAGGIVDGTTVGKGLAKNLDVRASLKKADAGAYLEKVGGLIHTGPTGTNVMDLMLAIKK